MLIKQEEGNSEDWEDMNDSPVGVQGMASLEHRSQKVTDRLLELQVKHKEISDRV